MRRFMDLFRKKEPEQPLSPVAPPPVDPAPVEPAAPAAPAAPVEAPAKAEVAQASVDMVLEGGTVAVKEIEEKVLDVLRNTFDPEIPVNIYELGLVYETRVADSGEVHIKMTLTSPACPVAGTLPPEVASKVRTIPGVTDVKLDLVWDPPWNPNMMSEAARLQLGMM